MSLICSGLKFGRSTHFLCKSWFKSCTSTQLMCIGTVVGSISLHKGFLHQESQGFGLNYQSIRYKKGGKKKQMEADREANRPEMAARGTVLDTDDTKKKMLVHIAKLQDQLSKIQPKFANASIVENIELSSLKNRPKIKNMADVTMSGTTHINILARESENNEDIIYALKHFNEHFDPRLESNGFIVCTVPRPSEAEMKQLQDVVKRRGEYCKKECQKCMKQALKQLNRLKDYLMKDDLYSQTQALNQLMKDQQALIDRAIQSKVQQILRG